MRIFENGKHRDATPAEIEAAKKRTEKEEAPPAEPHDARVEALEKTVAALKKEVAALKKTVKG